jgi:hypothetical protein
MKSCMSESFFGWAYASRSVAMGCEVRNGDVRLLRDISENIGAIFFLTVFRQFLSN